MSIIYGTLERLEQAEVQPLINLQASSTRKTPAISLKSIAVAMAGAGLGVGLVLWLEVSGGTETPLPRPAAEETAVVAEPVVAPKVVQPQPALVEITVEKTRLAPRVFEPKTKAVPPVETAEPVEAPARASVPSPAAVAVVTSAPVEDRVGPVIDRARVALSRGNYGLALSTLAALAEAPEERSEYWFVKGSAHLGLGQLAPAEFALSAARSLAPQSAQVVVQLSILFQPIAPGPYGPFVPCGNGTSTRPASTYSTAALMACLHTRIAGELRTVGRPDWCNYRPVFAMFLAGKGHICTHSISRLFWVLIRPCRPDG